ncbi:MAG: hypothetical protein P8P83_04215 [Rickettsiaceae bacterium]|nr:hypothetical protein [Rickettsiaceae bacterium]
MTKFKGSVNGQEVTININFTTNTLTNGSEVQNKVHISNLEIDDIQLIPL